MNREKLSSAVDRLEQNLPLRLNQLQLAPSLRSFHQSILRFFVESGHAPRSGDLVSPGDWPQDLMQLAREKIILLDQQGEISGAYPFVDETRGFRVISEYAAVNAMCAFDALAVSGMFSLPTRIEAECRCSGRAILIEQNGEQLGVLQPEDPVYAAIDWNARDSKLSCSASLCSEMMFISGAANARRWRQADPPNRELFELDEARAMISEVFQPLMQ